MILAVSPSGEDGAELLDSSSECVVCFLAFGAFLTVICLEGCFTGVEDGEVAVEWAEDEDLFVRDPEEECLSFFFEDVSGASDVAALPAGVDEEREFGASGLGCLVCDGVPMLILWDFFVGTATLGLEELRLG